LVPDSWMHCRESDIHSRAFLLAVAIARTTRTDFYNRHRLVGTELDHPMEAKMAADSTRVLRYWIWK
jgi:hypothetical protein